MFIKGDSDQTFFNACFKMTGCWRIRNQELIAELHVGMFVLYVDHILNRCLILDKKEWQGVPKRILENDSSASVLCCKSGGCKMNVGVESTVDLRDSRITFYSINTIIHFRMQSKPCQRCSSVPDEVQWIFTVMLIFCGIRSFLHCLFWMQSKKCNWTEWMGIVPTRNFARGDG